MQLDVSLYDLSWFACNIFVCPRLSACVFIHKCSRGFVLVLSFWIWSCTHHGTVAPSSLYDHHLHLLFLVVIVLLLPLVHGFTPASSTEHIPKYIFIEKIMKLPFQRVVGHQNRSSNEGVMLILFRRCVLSRKFSGRATFVDMAITAPRNLRSPCRLIRWNINFMVSLKIHIYPIVFFWGRAKTWWHLYLLMYWSGDVDVLILLSLGHHVAHPSASRSSPLVHQWLRGGIGVFHPWFLIKPKWWDEKRCLHFV